MKHLEEGLHLPPSIARVLAGRGLNVLEKADAFLNPALDQLEPPHAFGHMEAAVQRLLTAVRTEQPVAIYADRDVDGLTGLAVLARTLRSLGGTAVWGSPVKGRGVEREVLERLLQSGAKVMILVDCGTGEHTQLDWLAAQGVDVIVADHHRFSGAQPHAFAWIHPELLEAGEKRGAPAGCVMAFKLAQAIWLSFLGDKDPERMDYFLFSHLDLVCLGILADRVPLQGENRTLVWHGLRRLAYSRKAGISALTRFFRLTPRSGPLTVREVTWQLIPLLNAAGRLGRPDVAADLLITEDLDTARACIDELLTLNSQRRTAQDKSLTFFEEAVLKQCSVESDPVLVALAHDLEPSVTGLAAQALVRKYNRPVFLFVSQGEEAVGSGRGTAANDLFSWVEAQKESILKYGGHQRAVGLTIRTSAVAAFRERLLILARKALSTGAVVESDNADISSRIEAEIDLQELDELWWMALSRLAPYGMGHPMPLFQINKVDRLAPLRKRRSKAPLQELLLKNHAMELPAELDPDALTARGQQTVDQVAEGPCEGPWTVVGYPIADKSDRKFRWMIRDLWRTHG